MVPDAPETQQSLAHLLPRIIDGLIWLAEDETYRRPKASDIPDEVFLKAMSIVGSNTLDGISEKLGYPSKVVLAKAKKLVLKEAIEGCYCGRCDGWFYILPKELA